MIAKACGRLMAGIVDAALAVVFGTLAPAAATAQGPASGAADRPTLFIVGDSTVRTGTKGQMGWGDPIAKHFDKSKLNAD